jgi:hypothetical protein
VVYGLLAFVASLPGAGVLAVRWFGRRRAARRPVAAECADALHSDPVRAVVPGRVVGRQVGHRRHVPGRKPALRFASRPRPVPAVLVGQLSPNRSESA